MAKIVATNSSVAGMSHELGGQWETIGRADGNTFQIVEGSMSGRHCEVRLQGEELLVRDLLSTNGTFIDGKKITEGTLKPGQKLRLGDVEMRLEATAPATTPIPAPKPVEKTPGTSFTSKMLVTNAAAAVAGKPGAAPAPVEVKPAPQPAADSGPKFQILLVDDSLAFLEAFSDLCVEYSKRTWEVRTAPGADKALAALSEKSADLVVLDIGMPMLDGLQLLGIIARRYPELKIVVMTGNASDARRADALAKGAAMFLEKPMTKDGMVFAFNMLNDLVSWTHREGFTGSLREASLQDVIQMECLSRHSSIVEIQNSGQLGQVYIQDGSIIHTAVGTLVGEQAFYQLMALRGGEFHVKPFSAPAMRTIETRWEFLLMDAARATDEETVLLAKPSPEAIKPPAPAPLPPSSPPPPAPAEQKLEDAPKEEDTATHALGEDIIVVATYDGKWKPSDEPKPGPDK